MAASRKPKHEMKILFTGDYFWPMAGGAEISAFIICSKLASMGAKITVLTHRSQGTKPQETHNGLTIHRKRLVISESRNIVQRILLYLLASFYVVRFVSKTKPDVVLTQQLIATPTVLVSKLLGIPVIAIVRDYWPVCYYRSLLKPNGQICRSYERCLKDTADCAERNIAPSGDKSNFSTIVAAQVFSLAIFTHALLVNRIIKKANAIVTVSNFLKKILVKNGYNAKTIHVIYNPVIVNTNVASGDKSAYSSEILFVGFLDLKKGLQTVIKAMPHTIKKVKNAKLVVAGDGPERKSFENLVQSLNVENHVEFLGTKYGEDLEKLYNQCTLVVVPSIWPEPFGRVVAEALMHYKPVVASNVGGITELITPDVGILVPSEDESAFASAITAIIAKKASINFNTLTRTKFSPETISRQYLSLIESVRRK